MTARMSFTTVPTVSPMPRDAASSAVAPLKRPVAGRARPARSFPFQPLAAALALGFAAPSSDALPQGAKVVQGSAQMSQQGSHLQVTNTPGAVIHWQSFGIGSGQSVRFQQQSSRSTVLNRVTGGSASEILGTLSSNGRVFLVNGAGIVFGKGAVIDTAGFTASTLNISDADWKAGKVRLQADGVPGGISITDVVQVHGDLYLIAPQITNAGALKVHGGQAVLAAGQSVSITGRGLEGIQLEVVNAGDQVLNLGSVEAGAVGMFAGTLRHSGTVQANAVETVGGKVWLKARDSVDVSGSVAARRGTKGGEIVVTGASTRVASTASLDASGVHGGGQVYVGGGWQGRDAAIENALATRVDRGAQLKADAIEVGDGGTVVVWSDGHTASHGAISARGGAQGGNGGQVETSGKTLARSGLPDVSAPSGQAGTWLLDPDQVVIRAGFGSGGFTGDVAAGDVAPTEVFENEIEGYSGNLTIQARRAITGADWGGASGSDGILDAPVNGGLRLETTDASCPTSPCGIDLVSNGPSLIRALASSVSTSAVSLDFSAGMTNPAVAGDAFQAEVRVNSVRNSTGGAVSLAAHGNIVVDSIDTDATGAGGTWAAGNVQVRSNTGSLDIGDISARGASAPGATAGRGGDITLEGTQQVGGGSAVVVQGSVVTAGGAGSFEQDGGDAGDITVVLNAATDGSAGVLQLENGSPALFAFVPVSGSNGLQSLGGTGGDTFGTAAGSGGNGGNITIRGGTAATAIRIDAASGAQVVSDAGEGGSDASGSLGVLGVGGNAGLIDIQGADVTLDGGIYASLTRATSAGMSISADADDGAVQLRNGATLVVAGHDPGGSTVSAAQCPDCELSIQAGAGGVTQQSGSELIVTPTLAWQVGGDVTLDGAHALGQMHGSVTGDLSLAFSFNADDPQDLSLGAVLGSGSTSTSLGLDVGGNLTVTSGASAFVPVHIAAAVQVGQQATFNDLGTFSMGSSGSLNAGTAVSFVAQGDILLSPETHADSSDSSNEQLTLNSDEIARITAPVLRIDNTAGGASAGLFIEDNASGTPATLDLTAGGNIGQVVLRTAGTVSQGSTGIQADALRVQARTIDLANTGNQIDTVAFRATGSAGVHGTAVIASADGMTVGTVTNAIDGALAGGQATAATSASGSSFVDLDAGVGTFTLSEAVIGPAVRVAGAAIENGTPQGRIQATAAGTHAVTLEADGNIGGADSIAQAIRVQLADVSTDDQILVQAGSLSPVGLHIQGDGRTAQVDFGGATTDGQLALIADGDLTVDRSLAGFTRVGLASVSGNVGFALGTVSALSSISVEALQGDINGAAGLANPQLDAQFVSLEAAGDIAATFDASVLNVESQSSGGSVQLTNTGSGTLSILNGLNLGGDFELETAGALEVRALSGGALVQAQNVKLTAQGGITVAGASSTGPLEVPAAVVPAPTGSAAIVATDTLTLNAGGALTLEGGTTAAHIAGEHVNINATSLSLIGGTADGAYAAIQYGTDIVLGLPSGAALTFTPGSAADTDAVVYTNSATPNFVSVDPTWNCTPDCTPDFQHSTAGPVGNGQSNRGLTQAAAVPPEGGSETRVDIPVIQVLVQLQRVLEGERFGKVAVEAENVCR
ncbi:filamentous hemagglutinin N-terminal domain-containing protein [Schlegelella sp. S2-27]|uniref:Filamentous hemagglutinin N-terminal domain-containing protein n=1 Tax=Caldimonas mangrovi TaxID=2944811 RepID=A0ABT0YRH6_9BURK|nr:filamentous hemagglutinin N-terminal domain-containing protein [Caldimonas mangrovi]MCM5681353.1 filamentous hemagglutinin N-terminal domain-containing protein [Caldimonas mangrovi]